jgi:hypothetical protein
LSMHGVWNARTLDGKQALSKQFLLLTLRLNLN